jgi:sporulation protein YlmC with PRC-barrel domain
MLGLEEIIGLEMISSDARVVGTVEGVGIDTGKWQVLALLIGLRRGVEELLGRKRKYFAVDKVYVRTEELEAVSDSVIMRRPVSALGEAITAGEDSMTSAGTLMGMRVVCCNARFLGLVDNMIFDPDNGWTIPYLQVKLDRFAVDALNIRHPFMSSPMVVIRTSDIRALGDMVILSLTLEELKRFLESQTVVPLPSDREVPSQQPVQFESPREPPRRL